MVTIQIQTHPEGFTIGICDNNGPAWAEYSIVSGSKMSKRISNLILAIISKCEPFQGDKDTMSEYAKRKNK